MVTSDRKKVGRLSTRPPWALRLRLIRGTFGTPRWQFCSHITTIPSMFNSGMMAMAHQSIRCTALHLLLKP
jgi:hypothetical protein